MAVRVVIKFPETVGNPFENDDQIAEMLTSVLEQYEWAELREDSCLSEYNGASPPYVMFIIEYPDYRPHDAGVMNDFIDELEESIESLVGTESIGRQVEGVA